MKKKCELYVVIAAVLWGCIAVFHDLLRHEGFSHIQIVTIRVTSAAAVLTVYLLLRVPRMFRIRLRDWWCFAGTGIAGLLTFNWCYFVAMEMTGRAVAAALLYTAPAFVLLLSAVLFKEPLTARKISALVLALAGSVLVSGFSGGTHVIQRAGLLPAVGAGFSYALYSIFGKIALRKGYCAETISECTFFVCGGRRRPAFPDLEDIGAAGRIGNRHRRVWRRRDLLRVSVFAVYERSCRHGGGKGCRAGYGGAGGGYAAGLRFV